MTARIHNLLDELRAGLEQSYQSRFRGLCLFGSYARGVAQPQSDLDVLIVLDEISSYAAEVSCTSFLISDLSIKYGLSISRVFVTESDWQNGRGPFLDSAREEAIRA